MPTTEAPTTLKVTPAHQAELAAALPELHAAASVDLKSLWSWVVPIIMPVIQGKQAALWAFLAIAIQLPGWGLPDLLAKPAKGGTLILKDIGWALTHAGTPTKAQVVALLA